jgi:hypothetical protein
MHQGSSYNPSPFSQLHEAARIKLAEIEQLLKPYCPQEFVRNVITGLIRGYSEADFHCSYNKRLSEIF